MPILLTAALLVVTAAALAVLRTVRPRFRFGWLLAVTTTTAAWLSVFLWLPGLPLSLAIPLWQSASSSISFATFVVGSLSWPYACCLVTMALAVLLTAPARANFPSPSGWASCLAVTGLGIFAVTAGSPLTLVLFWAGLDLAEAGVVLARTENRSSSAQVPFAFTVRLGSTALVLLALVLVSHGQTIAGFDEIQGPSTNLLLAAALLRLAAFAIPWPNVSTELGPDETGMTLHLVAGASSVAFLSRMEPAVQNIAWPSVVVCAAAVLFAGWMWLRAPDRHLGRSVWVMGTGSLAVAAVLRGNPMGATGWGITMLLAGSPLFLATVHERWMNQMLLAGLWLGSAMPFAVTATAWLGGGGRSDWMLPAFLIAQALLLAGLLNQVLRPEISAPRRVEVASLRGIYRAGIVLPLIVGILLGLWGWPGAFRIGAPVAGITVVPLVAVLAWAKRRFAQLNPVESRWFPPEWHKAVSTIQHEAARLQGGAQRAAEAFTRTMEGEAGIMWSLLFLVLFVSLIASRDR